jgi:ABC-type glycerol-3-phosphate transport system substrate-binding protein
MKKVIALLAIVGFAACNSGAKTSTTDSTKTTTVDTVKTTIMDTSKAAMDSMKKTTDTTKKM